MPQPDDIGPRLRAVVFDFDGTLTVPTLDFSLMRGCAAKALAGIAPWPAGERAPVMEELDSVCAALDPKTAEQARKLVMRAIEAFELEAAARSGLLPFVRPMLAAFKERGIIPAVITRNFRAGVQAVFPDAYEQFACVLTRYDVPKLKPDPDHLLRALRSINCNPEEALMVGDHPMDIEVGKQAGTFTAGVASGESTLESLRKAGPDFVAEDAGGLMRMLGLMP